MKTMKEINKTGNEQLDRALRQGQHPVAFTFTVNMADINLCPKRSLSARHYRLGGGCRCFLIQKQSTKRVSG